MTRILLTSYGATVSLHVANALRSYDAGNEPVLVGVHSSPVELLRGAVVPSVKTLIVPRETDAYADALVELVRQLKIDLLVPTTDEDVAKLAPHAHRFACHHLIPDPDLVAASQDKFRLYEILHAAGCRVAPNARLQGGSAATAFDRLPSCERYWVRHRTGSGAYAATWVKTADQAQKWIDLCCALHGMQAKDFIVAPFLPGNDYATAVVFQHGAFVVGKAYQRLEYYRSTFTLSAMGSTPRLARSTGNRAPVEHAVAGVTALYRHFGREPHGLFYCDLKCDADGQPCLTEINIGRFHMTAPIYDRIGQYKLIPMYARLALEPDAELPRGIYDLQPGIVALRELDVPLQFTDMDRIRVMRESRFGRTDLVRSIGRAGPARSPAADTKLPKGKLRKAYQAALAHDRAGRLGPAEQGYRSVLRTAPRNVDALHKLAAVCRAQGRLKEAVAIYRRALSVAPGHGALHLDLAMALEALREFEPAEEHLQNAIAAQPTDPEPVHQYARFLADRERWDQALAACRQAIALMPTAQSVLQLSQQVQAKRAQQATVTETAP